VCLSVGTTVSCAQTAEAIEMLFAVGTRVGPGSHVFDGGADHPKGRGNFGRGVLRLAVHSNLQGMACAGDAGLRQKYFDNLLPALKFLQDGHCDQCLLSSVQNFILK